MYDPSSSSTYALIGDIRNNTSGCKRVILEIERRLSDAERLAKALSYYGDYSNWEEEKSCDCWSECECEATKWRLKTPRKGQHPAGFANRTLRTGVPDPVDDLNDLSQLRRNIGLLSVQLRDSLEAVKKAERGIAKTQAMFDEVLEGEDR